VRTPLSPEGGAPAPAMAALLAFALVIVLGGCGTVGTRAPGVERSPDAQTGTAPRPGGYYKDDGPGDSPPANLDAIADAQPRIEPLHRFANNPYNIFGRDYVPLRDVQAYRERGVGSWYGRKFHGQRTSSGEPYDMYAMTAAHPVLPIPSYARVTNVSNGRSVVVRINDRGPFHSGRVIDLSYTAAWKLGYAGNGSTLLEVEAVTPEDIAVLASRRSTGETRPITAAAADVRPVPPAAAPAGVPLEPVNPVAPPPVPVAAEASGVYLQLGAFSARENAENFRSRISSQLTWLDRAMEVLQRDGLFRLHLGPYRDRAEAGGIAERIREALDLKAVFVIR
jgi:rare lipoprotein A